MHTFAFVRSPKLACTNVVSQQKQKKKDSPACAMGFLHSWPLYQWFITPCYSMNFMLHLFVKNHWCTWRANQLPLIGETLFSFVPPSNSLVSVSDPWRALDLPLAIASRTTEIQEQRQVCCARLGGPRTPWKTTDTNLDCGLCVCWNPQLSNL